jgi:uncharacterized glyoxalase superfamily protein PhnB
MIEPYIMLNGQASEAISFYEINFRTKKEAGV